MTSKLNAHERIVVAAFAALSLAAGTALLQDMQILSFAADQAPIVDVVSLVRRLLMG